MKALLVNGSPRKDGNVVRLLEEAKRGLLSKGAEVELVHLYDYSYKGCISCFSCKRLPEPSACCAQRDELTPVLNKAYEADILLLGTPVYFAAQSSGMRAFLERLLYKYPHAKGNKTYKPTGFVYSMNATAEQVEALGYKRNMHGMEDFLQRHFVEPVDTVWANDTWQFEDYSAYDVAADLDRKGRQREEQFPKDLQAAYDLGVSLAEKAAAHQA
jgi:multimeric flavodoxin WrbA